MSDEFSETDLQEIYEALADMPRLRAEMARQYFERIEFLEKTFGKVIDQVLALEALEEEDEKANS